MTTRSPVARGQRRRYRRWVVCPGIGGFGEGFEDHFLPANFKAIPFKVTSPAWMGILGYHSLATGDETSESANVPQNQGTTKFPMSSWERESCVGAVKRQEDVKLEEPAPKKRAVMVKHLDWRETI